MIINYNHLLRRSAAGFLSALYGTTRPRKKSEGTTMYKTITAGAPHALSVLRIYTGLLLLEHGTAKILGFPAVPSFANVEINSLTGASGLIELVGGVVFTLGLFTRPV